MHNISAQNNGRVKWIQRGKVHPINVAERTVARDLLGQAVGPGVLALGDTQYESSPLHTVCRLRGGRLLTPLRGRARSGDQVRRMDPGQRQLTHCGTANPRPWNACYTNVNASSGRSRRWTMPAKA